jgi:2-polyprenyl-6-methoxyphenol hydroxylase-like FAD-dependent oxidoreductase
MGASMAGLLAARVLADAFDDVVVIDRDHLPDGAEARRGVPQGRHVHVLLARGRQVLDVLLPGLGRDLIARGALRFDPSADGRYHLDRDRLLAVRPSEMQAILLTRPLLEDAVRRRVLDFARVRALTGATAEPVLEEGRVCGVRLDGHGCRGETLDADLVVDATGRGSRTPAWLERHGLPRPTETTVDVGIVYTSYVFPRRPDDLDGVPVVLSSARPEQRRLAVALAIEGNRWLVTAIGYRGDRPSDGVAGLRAFLDTTDAPEVAALARSREPLQEPTAAMHRFPLSLRRHYERLSTLPDGLIVTGDALASFNPVYGQGMTVAALEALGLRDALAGGPVELSRRYTTAAGRIVDQVWDMSAGSDLALPFVPGPRPLMNRVLNGYVDLIARAGTVDPDVAMRFLRVVNMLDGPEALFAPRMALGVVRGARTASRSAVGSATGSAVDVPRPRRPLRSSRSSAPSDLDRPSLPRSSRSGP